MIFRFCLPLALCLLASNAQLPGREVDTNLIDQLVTKYYDALNTENDDEAADSVATQIQWHATVQNNSRLVGHGLIRIAYVESYNGKCSNDWQSNLVLAQLGKAWFSNILISFLLACGIVFAAIGINRFRQLKRSRSDLEKIAHNRTSSLEMSLKRSKMAGVAKSEFLAKVNHELRNPLTAIIGYCELLDLKRNDFDLSVNEYVTGLNSSSQHLLDLVDDFMEVLQIEDSNSRNYVRHFQLDDLVKDVSNVVSNEVKQSGLYFRCIISTGAVVALFGDDNRLKRMLINLISNAIRNTAEGRIIVTINVTSIVDSKVQLKAVVEDTGCGIPKEYLKTAFEPFSQIQNGSRWGGNGLGLYLTKTIVHHLGGDIQLQSESGKGTTVTISLPMQSSPKTNCVTADHYCHELQRD